MATHILPNQEVVGNTDRTGDKTLNFQQFFAMSLGLSVENIYYIAIAVLACVLGAEIAGICMLIGKLRRARNDEADVQNDEFNMGGGANYAIAAISFGAVSATLELALLVLAIAAAVGAFVLCALLAVLYAKGYLLISDKVEKSIKEQPTVPAYAEQQEIHDEPVEGQDENGNEINFADYFGNDDDTQQGLDGFLADEEEDTPDTTEERAVVAEDPNTSVAESGHTIERTIITEGVPGQAPIVEKHIIETTREVIRETNTTTVTEDKNANPVTEEMRKAIDELKQLGLQLRMEREIAVAHPAQENGEAIDADEEELDELDAEDELDVEDEAEREADAEENDDEYESDLFGNERIVGFDEETGCYIIARYRKSCEAKLMQSRPATKKYYSAIRNALMGYEGTKERMSWSIDTYTNDRTQIAKINIRPRTLDLYLALEPSTLEDSVYRGRDVGGKKKYAETPFLYKINSPRKLTLALELVQRACEEQGLSPIDIEEVNYEEQYPFTETETLITRGLIREYLREEKPAATFELDPDHVPQLVQEDETVIPANANFTWEFDNDQPEVEEVIEEVVEEEPAVEEVVVEEPAPAVPVSGTTTTTTTHETIRTTERHYTERYYSTGAQAEATEETRTIEVLPEPTAQPIEAEAEEAIPEVADEPTIEEAPVEETVEEIEEAVEEVSEETDEVQSSVAALFGDDVNQEDEPTQDETASVAVEEAVEEIVEEEIVEEVYEEEPVEEPEEVLEEVVEEIEEEIEEEPVEEIEEEIVEEIVEEYYEEEPEEEIEEEYYEEVVEKYYEEEPEGEEEYYEEVVEEYYEEEPEAEEEEYYEEVVEEYYEEEPQEELEEEYYEEEIAEEEYYDEEEIEEEVEEETVEEEVEEEVVEEEPAPQPVSDVVLLDVCLFDDYFDNGAIVNLETLKQVGLAHEGATRLKVYASGALKGQFTVEANHFTLDAIKAISDADGDSIMIR